MLKTVPKIIVKILFVAAVFFIGFYFGAQQVFSPTANIINENFDEPVINTEKSEENISNGNPVLQQQQKKQVVTIIINDGSLTKRYEDISYTQGMNVFDALKQVTSNEGIDLKYQDYGGSMGVFIEGIGGLENNYSKNLYWQYWVNGLFATIGASSYTLKSGDSIEWKYTQQQFANN